MSVDPIIFVRRQRFVSKLYHDNTPWIFAHTPTFEFRQPGGVSHLCVRHLGFAGPVGGAGRAGKGPKTGATRKF